jgi:deazaflavin-dependent oxidoreductase (nitroreductase family)
MDLAQLEQMNQNVIEDFRSNGGKVGGMFEGAPVVLVTHKGAKSGKERVSPLVYSKDGDDYVLIASFAGAPKNPAWYYNLKAHPEATIEVGEEKFRVRVREAEGAERDRLFQQQAEVMPQFNEYQEKTDRVIPVLVLERV